MSQKVPGHVADDLMRRVPFSKRPKALQTTVVMLILGGGMSLIFGLILIIDNPFSFIIGIAFVAIGVLAVISVILLSIPKRIGWHLAVVTSFLGLLGIGPGTLIAICAIIGLLWKSTKFYFDTGMWPPPMGAMPGPMSPYPPQYLPPGAMQYPPPMR